MKTSNLILLIFFIAALLSITAVLFALRSFNDRDSEPSETSSRSMEMQLKLSEFNKIDVHGKFNIHYNQDTVQRVMVKADSNLIALSKLEVRDSTLLITTTKKLRGNKQIDLYISNKLIKEIKSREGATFKTLAKIKLKELKIEGSDGSVYDIDGDFTDLNLEVSTGCVANLTGNCKNMDIESSTGCVIKASGLVSNNLKISSSTGCVASVNVTGDLEVEASTGTVISCSGNPKIKKWDVSTGAVVNK